VPRKHLDSALHPVLAGTLNATGVTDGGETVLETFRFSELTLVITSDRLVKHIGNAVWDEEFEEYHYDGVTDLAFEEGNVATTVVLTHDGRRERFKAPNERARELRERLTGAVLSHHGVDSLAALRERFAAEEESPPSTTMSFGEGPTPLSANPGELAEEPKNATRVDGADTDADAETAGAGVGSAPAASEGEADAAATDARGDDAGTAGTTGSADTRDAMDAAGTGTTAEGASEAGAEQADGDVGDVEEPGPAGVDRVGADSLLGGPSGTERDAESADIAALAAEVEALRESVEAQNERIARQEELIERLIAELRSRL
jgi:hypothetical protein